MIFSKRVSLLALAVGGVFSAANAQAQAPQPGALPQGENVISGSASISRLANQMDITTGAKAILNWDSFDIGSDATVNFYQPSADSVALNRVLGQNPSAIYGALNANGQVFLVNPNGVLFGPNAQVDVGGLVASALGITNANFVDDNYLFERGDSEAEVQNLGLLEGNYVVLAAPRVVNQGSVIAGSDAALVAGERVRLNLVGNQLIEVEVEQSSLDSLAENQGLIQAPGGQVLMEARSAQEFLGQVVNSGVIEASGLVNEGGVVRLVASSNIDLGGSIAADAGTDGDGGSIIAIADPTNPDSSSQVSGSLSAQGGSASGNGGSIETSGSRVQLSNSAVIDTSAENGQFGNWLLDHADITVAVVRGDLTGAALSAQLALNNVTLSSASTDTEEGNIFIHDSVVWDAATSLTLSAANHIRIQAPIGVSNAGGALALEVAQAGEEWDYINFGTYFINAPVSLVEGAGFSVKTYTDGAVVHYNVINNATELAAIADDLTGNYVLGNSFSAPLTSWAPLGTEGTPFSGNFDGLLHSIDGLMHTNAGSDSNVGLFGGNVGLIQNIGLTNVNIAGSINVGALAGYNNGFIVNSYATGIVTGSGAGTVGRIGGLVGFSPGPVQQSYADVDVTATSGNQVGNPYTGSRGGIGGLVGVAGSGIADSYTLGDVTGGNYVGGLVGYNLASISSTFAGGRVSGTTNAGGLVGGVDYGPGFPFIFSSFFDSSLDPLLPGGGNLDDEIEGISTSALATASTFAAWDPNVWELSDGLHPRLKSMLIPIFVYADDVSGTYTGNAFTAFTNTASYNNTFYAGTPTYTTAPDNPAISAGLYGVLPGGLTATNPNYRFEYAPGTLTINPAPLTPVLTTLRNTVIRTYDGTNIATLNPDNFLLSGFLNGDSATVTQTLGTFASANVNANPAAAQTVSVSLDVSDYAANGLTDLANYSLTTGTIEGEIGFITPRMIDLVTSGLVVDSKVYDGTTAANLSGSASLNFADAGCGINGQACALDLANLGVDSAALTAMYFSANVSQNPNGVLVSGFGLTGSAAGNYILAGGGSTLLDGTGTITPKAITAGGVSVIDRVYDGTTNLPLENLLGDIVFTTHDSGCGTSVDGQICAGDLVSYNTPNIAAVAATYNDKDVADANSVTLSGFVLAGTAASNYSLSPIVVPAAILPRPIQVALNASALSSNGPVAREYNGTATANAFDVAALLNPDVSSWGFIGSDDARTTFSAQYGDFDPAETALTDVTGFVASADAGERAVLVTYDGWAAFNSDIDLNNYLFPTNQVMRIANPDGPGSLMDIGRIDPKALGLLAAGVVLDSRPYDGTTNASFSFVGGDSAAVLSAHDAGCGVAGDGRICAGDAAQLALDASAWQALYQSKDVVTADNPVTISNLVLNGAAAGNYLLANEGNLVVQGAGTITPRDINLPNLNNLPQFSRVYDGTTAIAPSTESDFHVGLVFALGGAGSYNFVTGEGATPNLFEIDSSGPSVTLSYVPGATVAYADANAAEQVDVVGSWAGWTAQTGTLLSNYNLPTAFSSTAGRITPRPIAVTLFNEGQVSRAYNADTDGSVNDFVALFFGSSFEDWNFVAGQGATAPVQAVTYADANAAAEVDLYVTYGNWTPLPGTNLSNYSFFSGEDNRQLFEGLGEITPKLVNAVGLVGRDKVYDGTTTAQLDLEATDPDSGVLFHDSGCGSSLDGLACAGDAVEITPSGPLLMNFNSKDVVSASHITITGLASTNPNYQLAPIVLDASITPRDISVQLLENASLSRIYNGTNQASATDFAALLSADYVDWNFVTGERATPTVSPFYVGTSVATTDVISDFSNWMAGEGTLLSNYTLPSQQTFEGIANITPKALDVFGLEVVERVYDGTTDAVLSGNPTFVINFFGGCGTDTDGTLCAGDFLTPAGDALGTYDSRNVLQHSQVTVTGLHIAPGLDENADVSNYYLNPIVLAAAGTITPRQIVLPATGDLITKEYDLTTDVKGSTGTKNDPLILLQYLGIFGNSEEAAQRLLDAGFLEDEVFLPLNLDLSYATANVTETPQLISGTLSNWIAFSPNSDLNNFIFPDSVSNLAGIITPKEVGLSATRVYDGTTALNSGVSIFTGDANRTLTYTDAVADQAGVGAGNFIADIQLADGSDLAINYRLPELNALNAPVNITPAALTVSGQQAVNRFYNGSISVAVTGGQLGGLFGDDDVAITSPGTGGLATPAAGDARPVTVVNLQIGGADAVNYRLPSTFPSLTVDIAKAPLSISLNNIQRVYDGNASFFLFGNYGTLSGVLAGEEANVNVGFAAATLPSRNVGTYTGLADFSIALGGTGASNYAAPTITNFASVVTTVTPRPITVSGLVGVKQYDTNVNINLSGTPTFVGAVANDNIQVALGTARGTFDFASAGTTRIVTYLDGLIYSGTDLPNYSITVPNIAGSITPAPLTITALNQTKESGQAFHFRGNEFTAVGLLGNDQITSITLSSLGSSATADVGTSTPITPIWPKPDSITNNYAITYIPGTMTIKPAPLKVFLTHIAALAQSNPQAFSGTRTLRVLLQEVQRRSGQSNDAIANGIMADIADDNCIGNCARGVPQETGTYLGTRASVSDFAYGLSVLFKDCNCRASNQVLSTWFTDNAKYVSQWENSSRVNF